MPGSEGVANAIDGKPTKYLNFDTRTGGKPSGFIVTPSVGATRVVGIAIQSANDAPERDPKNFTIEGSNDDTVTAWDAGTWELIKNVENFPAFANRFETQTMYFDNFKPYKHYRWTVLQTQTENGCCMQVAEVQLLGTLVPQPVAQPGDPILASSANMPGSEGVANAIDGKPTKYLNFDTRTGGKPSGFIVSPSIGRTLITGITMQSANDAPERDPKTITIEGSNDDAVTAWDAGNWELIIKYDNIPAFTARFQSQTFLFDNYKPYKHYRWTTVATQTENGCCMQVAEVQLLGTGAPKDVTQPGDPIIASSANMPGSEGVANVIDGKPTKYLNFDTRTGGKPSGFAVTPTIGATTVIGMTIQSANDAPERDPKVLTLEGSNDDALTTFDAGTWELIVKLDAIPAWANRFETQEFFFPNKKSYKHYRWTVLQTQTENGCCMQVAEVELLAVTAQTDCTKAKFLVQPVNTPALAGATATFSATVNGPWPLQWYKNGAMIPGASAATYTTEAVTAVTETNVYSVEIVGCEMSSEVKAYVFTPAAVKSIAVNFIGGGANGSPTSMSDADIAGLQLQAHWNNATNASGITGDQAALPDVMLDSDGKDSTITVEYASSGNWGSGTGDGNPTQRMLNGLVHSANTVGAEPSTIKFHSVPSGKHSVIAYMVGIPLQFQNGNYKISGKADQTYYVRVMNVDEYNAAPGFYRGASTDPAVRSLATYVRFDNVEANVDGDITLAWQNETAGFDRGIPVNGIQLLLNSPAASAPPVITADPQPTMGPADGSVTLSVTATGEGLTYQWRKAGRNLPNSAHVSGATSAALRISNLSAEDEDVYSVAVFNSGGSVVSKNAAVTVSKYDVKDALVGHWKFDETSGASAANAAAGGKPAAITGTASWGAGKVANALTFDGSTTYGKVDSYTVGKRQLAASGWVNVDSGIAAGVAFLRNAEGALGIGTGAGPGTPAGQFEFGLSWDSVAGTAALNAAIGAGPNIIRASAPTAFGLGAWHHVAFSADGARLDLYLDGAKVASADYLADVNVPDIAYLAFGARLNKDTNQEPAVIVIDPTTPDMMLGKLDDFGLWTRALTPDEVSKIYAAGQAGKDLETIVLEPPVTTETKFSSIKVGTDGKITIEWTGGGTLQAAPSVTGPWEDVAGATSPYTFTPSSAMLFGRIKN